LAQGQFDCNRKVQTSFESTAPSTQHWAALPHFRSQTPENDVLPAEFSDPSPTPTSDIEPKGKLLDEPFQDSSDFASQQAGCAALFEDRALIESRRTLVEEGARARGLFPGALLEPLRLDNFFAAEGTSHAARENCSTSQFTCFCLLKTI